MNEWCMREGSITRGPYSICPEIHGYSIWYRKDEHFGRLRFAMPTLTEAKQYCADHAKEAALLKSLEAVNVK